ncbi:MAG TPA: hypothetical protein VKV17_10965 [Bryobacteraceae bacterium]|nr:hypothetical protein [Bryobacteraceae bacterium]
MFVENPLNASSLAFPVLEYVHIIGFTCGVGTIALVNFRLLGVGLTQKSAGQLWRDTLPWTLAGLLLVIFSGLLLFAINPDVYYGNQTFLLKMGVLLLAILFYYTAVRKVSVSGAGLAASRAVAGISLGLWMMVLCGGIFIGLSATRPPAAAPPPAGVHFEDFLGPGAGNRAVVPPRPN